MSLTLRDVARLANVSPSTVSRVLNNYPYVGEATRELVLQAAQELGYPLTNLRRSSTHNARTVLLLTRFQCDAEIQDMAPGIERFISLGAQSVLEQFGITARVQHTFLESLNNVSHPLSYLQESTIVGFILLGGVVNRQFINILLESRIPFVVAGAHVRPLDVNCVMADYRDGIEQVVLHLAKQGRRRIGMVNGLAATTSSEEKYKGFRLGLSLCGLDFSPERVVSGDFTSEAGYIQTLRLLEQAPDLDAIVYADDNMALGGLHALREYGRRVPDQVAVTGFYNYDVARYTDPPLTSVAFDMRSMGAIAAQRLKMLIDNPDDSAWSVLLPTSLVIRHSTIRTP